MKTVKDLIAESLQLVLKHDMEYDNEDIRQVIGLLQEAINILDGNIYSCETCGNDTDKPCVVCDACDCNNDYE